jgi:hypothetical protein
MCTLLPSDGQVSMNMRGLPDTHRCRQPSQYIYVCSHRPYMYMLCTTRYMTMQHPPVQLLTGGIPDARASSAAKRRSLASASSSTSAR